MAVSFDIRSILAQNAAADPDPQFARLGFIALMVAVAAWLVFTLSQRAYLGYATETDYIGAFIPDARRFLAGEPLLAEFHPPLFSITIGSLNAVIGDWLTTGLVLTAALSLLAVYCAFRLFADLFGPWFGLAAALVTATSSNFLIYSAQTTSDIAFLAVFLGAAALAGAAARGGSAGVALAAGVAIGLAIFLRTNGAIAILLMALPFFVSAPRIAQIRQAGLMLGGLGAVVLAMIGFAAATGSALFPTGSVNNLAMTYYSSGDRFTAEAMAEVAGKFDSALDVLLHDPVRVLTIYAKDLARLLLIQLPGYIVFPLGYLGAAGILLLALRATPLQLAFIAVTALNVLFINLKTFEPRFYLFIAPWLGAGLWALLQALSQVAPQRAAQAAMVAAALWLAVGGARSAVSGVRYLERLEAEPASMADAGLFETITADASVVARKPHLAFYADATRERFPNAPDLATLCAALDAQFAEAGRDPAAPAYLFFGAQEAGARKPLAALRTGDEVPDWLAITARGERWTLYQIDRARLATCARRGG